MYVYTEKDLENIRKENVDHVQDITSLAVNPATGFVAWYPELADKLVDKLENVPEEWSEEKNKISREKWEREDHMCSWEPGPRDKDHTGSAVWK